MVVNKILNIFKQKLIIHIFIDENIDNYRYIGDISTNILKKKLGSLKLIKTYENIEKNCKNDIINHNIHFKVVL